jgi:hypothetical protein
MALWFGYGGLAGVGARRSHCRCSTAADRSPAGAVDGGSTSAEAVRMTEMGSPPAMTMPEMPFAIADKRKRPVFGFVGNGGLRGTSHRRCSAWRAA